MKKFVFLLTMLLMALNGQAQRLQGWFRTVAKEQGFHTDLFHFAGNRFFYCSSGCLGAYTGQGTFAVKAGRLLLYFEKSPADTERVQGTLPCPSATAAPTFCFQVIDRTSKDGLPGVSIISQKTGTGVQTDGNGAATFSYAPPPNDVVVVRFLGYEAVSIPVTSAVSQGFVVRLGPPYYFSKDDTLAFQLKQVRPASFALRSVLDDEEPDDEKPAFTHCERLAVEEGKKISAWRTKIR